MNAHRPVHASGAAPAIMPSVRPSGPCKETERVGARVNCRRGARHLPAAICTVDLTMLAAAASAASWPARDRRPALHIHCSGPAGRPTTECRDDILDVFLVALRVVWPAVARFAVCTCTAAPCLAIRHLLLTTSDISLIRE